MSSLLKPNQALPDNAHYVAAIPKKFSFPSKDYITQRSTPVLQRPMTNPHTSRTRNKGPNQAQAPGVVKTMDTSAGQVWMGELSSLDFKQSLRKMQKNRPQTREQPFYQGAANVFKTRASVLQSALQDRYGQKTHSKSLLAQEIEETNFKRDQKHKAMESHKLLTTGKRNNFVLYKRSHAAPRVSEKLSRSTNKMAVNGNPSSSVLIRESLNVFREAIRFQNEEHAFGNYFQVNSNQNVKGGAKSSSKSALSIREQQQAAQQQEETLKRATFKIGKSIPQTSSMRSLDTSATIHQMPVRYELLRGKNYQQVELLKKLRCKMTQFQPEFKKVIRESRVDDLGMPRNVPKTGEDFDFYNHKRLQKEGKGGALPCDNLRFLGVIRSDLKNGPS